VIVANAPRTSLRGLDSPGSLWKRDADGNVDTLLSLCHLFHMGAESMPAIRHTMKQVDGAANSLLRAAGAAGGAASDSAPAAAPGVALTAQPRPGLVTAAGASEGAVAAAEAGYEAAYSNLGEVDDRLLWTDKSAVGDPAALTPRKPVPGAAGGAAPASRGLGLASTPFRPNFVPSAALMTPAAPRGVPVPYTPISGTLRGAQWLAAVAAEEPDPLSGIPAAFASLPADRAQAAITGAHELILSVLQSGPASEPEIFQPPHVAGRPLQALKLWVRAVRAMADAAGETDRPAALRRILDKPRTVRVMVAVCLEMVSGAARLSDLKFPAIPEKLGLDPFDLFKLVKPLTKGEPGMPEDVKRHMGSVLASIVERYAWEARSPLYAYLCAATGRPCPPHALSQSGGRGAGGAASASAGLAASESGLAATQSLAASAAPGAAPGAAAGAGPPERAGPGPAPGAAGGLPRALDEEPPEAPGARQLSPLAASSRRVVEDLIADAVKLSHERMQGILQRLPPQGFLVASRGGAPEQQDKRVVLSVAMRLVGIALRRATSLLYNRHLDQVMLCSLYGVCRVLRIDVKFKDIVDAYQKQGQCDASVFRNVVLQQTEALEVQERNDIIKFYNKVFMPATKGPLLETGEQARLAQDRLVQSAVAAAQEGRAGEAGGAGAGSSPPTPTHSRTAPTAMTSPKPRMPSGITVSPLKRPPGAPKSPGPHPMPSSSLVLLGQSIHAFENPGRDLSDINRGILGERSAAEGDAGEGDGPARKKHRLATQATGAAP